MEEHAYPYTAHGRVGQLGYTYRPLVEVNVGSEADSRNFKALVDSGTDLTVMDRTIADLLGIEPEGYPAGKLSGIGDWKEGFVAPVSLRFKEFDQVFNFRVLFIENLHDNFSVILGQQDFFNHFKVEFDRRNKSFKLSLLPLPEEE